MARQRHNGQRRYYAIGIDCRWQSPRKGQWQTVERLCRDRGRGRYLVLAERWCGARQQWVDAERDGLQPGRYQYVVEETDDDATR